MTPFEVAVTITFHKFFSAKKRKQTPFSNVGEICGVRVRARSIDLFDALFQNNRVIEHRSIFFTTWAPPRPCLSKEVLFLKTIVFSILCLHTVDFRFMQRAQSEKKLHKVILYIFFIIIIIFMYYKSLKRYFYDCES